MRRRGIEVDLVEVDAEELVSLLLGFTVGRSRPPKARTDEEKAAFLEQVVEEQDAIKELALTAQTHDAEGCEGCAMWPREYCVGKKVAVTLSALAESKYLTARFLNVALGLIGKYAAQEAERAAFTEANKATHFAAGTGGIVEQAVRREAEASVRLDGETHPV